MKVSELSDEKLDCWVGKADGKEVLMRHGMAHFLYQRKPNGHEVYHAFSPSTDWSQGGPIIEREEITTANYFSVPGDKKWGAWMNSSPRIYGPTPLIAAMRCYVSSKFGEEVDDSQAHNVQGS